MDIVLILLAVAVVAGALFGFYSHARTQWLSMRPRMFGSTGWIAGPGGRISARLDAKAWSEAYHDLLDSVARNLSQDPLGIEAAEAIRGLAFVETNLAWRTRDSAGAALRSGEMQSWLVERDGLVVATVVIPARHEHPRLLRRYEPLRDGWRDFAEGLFAAARRDGRDTRLLILLFFLNPDARDGVLIVSYRSEAADLSPVSLADDPRAAAARSYPDRFEFRLS